MVRTMITSQGFTSSPLCRLKKPYGNSMAWNDNQCLSVSSIACCSSPLALSNPATGPVSGDWLAQASPDIQARMAQYEENQIEFAILSLVKDPLIDLQAELAGNINSLIAIHLRLNEVQPDWRSFTADDYDDSNVQHKPGYLTGPDAGLGLTQEHISSSLIAQGEDHQFKPKSATAALTRRKELIAAQQSLRVAIQEEIQSKHSEQDRASARARDSGAKMQKFARKVQAKKGA